MPGTDEGTGSVGTPASTGEPTPVIEVDGQKLTAQQVKDMLAERASITQKGQHAEALLAASQRIGLPPEELLRQSEGALSALTQLYNMGVVDERGRPIQSRTGEDWRKNLPAPPRSDGQPNPQTGGEPAPSTAIVQVLEALHGKVKELETANTHLVRERLEERIKAAHPNITPEETQIAMRRAQTKGSSLWDELKVIDQGKQSYEQQLREKLAKEWGVDVEALNRLKEQSGGGGFALPPGKKISFRGGADTVTPRQALASFLKGRSDF